MVRACVMVAVPFERITSAGSAGRRHRLARTVAPSRMSISPSATAPIVSVVGPAVSREPRAWLTVATAVPVPAADASPVSAGDARGRDDRARQRVDGSTRRSSSSALTVYLRGAGRRAASCGRGSGTCRGCPYASSSTVGDRQHAQRLAREGAGTTFAAGSSDVDVEHAGHGADRYLELRDTGTASPLTSSDG